jgi:hypothetical protein
MKAHSPRDDHAETLEQVKQRLFSLWLAWGLLPLGLALVLVLVMNRLHPVAQSSVPEQLALGFKTVMAVGGALFLLGFWLDGRWTEANRLAHHIWKAAGGDGDKPSPAALKENAHLAMDSLMLSVQLLTGIGVLIGLCAVLGAAAGLDLHYTAQIFLLALAFQIFIFSRHPYYHDLMRAALRGELLAEEPAK